jgi:hypothetical protein
MGSSRSSPSRGRFLLFSPAEMFSVVVGREAGTPGGMFLELLQQEEAMEMRMRIRSVSVAFALGVRSEGRLVSDLNAWPHCPGYCALRSLSALFMQ